MLTYELKFSFNEFVNNIKLISIVIGFLFVKIKNGEVK